MQPVQQKTDYAFLNKLTDRILSGGAITRSEALKLARLHAAEDIVMLMAHAHIIRRHFKGARVDLCAIVNARSGRCPEDCIFCAQSAHYKTEITTYPLLAKRDILAQARQARDNRARHFSIVTSGRGINGADDINRICAYVTEISETGSIPCASLGILTREQFAQLREAGLKRYHHNLETAESHFGSICTTHSYAERVQTIRLAQEAGFEVCAGGIFGMGETPQQRIELAFTLRELNVDSVPLNFLHPIPGTPAEKYQMLSPLEIVKIISLFRFVLPEKEIRVCGGRETGLRTLQPLMYIAGASGTMIGNYLTTSGRDPATDLREIIDLGLTVESKE